MSKYANNSFYQTKRAPYTKAKGPKQLWPESLSNLVDMYECELVVKALREAGGNITDASDLSGMGRSTFAAKMQKYALSARDFVVKP
jgi:DNA-binding NtrC family response regulator